MSDDSPSSRVPRGGAQSFSVEAIRARLLPDDSSTPAERARALCGYIEEDFPQWSARYAPDPELASGYAMILLTRNLCRVELIVEALPSHGPMVVKTRLFFLDYQIEAPPLPQKCLHNKAIAHALRSIERWLLAQAQALRPAP